MQAVVLVGGLGTRLGALTRTTPKPLLPVGDRPFLAWLIANVERFGFDRILLLAGRHSEQILEFACGHRGRARLECIAEPSPLGTAGALRNAAERLEPEFLFLNGDSLFDFNFLDLAMRGRTAPIGGIALRPIADTGRYGRVEVSDRLITGFYEKSQSGPGLINGGVYWLKRDIIPHLPTTGSLERDVFPTLPPPSLVGQPYDGFFIDIGVPADYERAQSAIPTYFTRPAAFLDRDGTLNDDTGYVHDPDQFRWLPGAMETIKRLNDLGYLVLVVTNQAGIARGFYRESNVVALHAWMNDQLRPLGAHIDAFYFCPHHPIEGVDEYRVACGCRKPEPGLVIQAAREWNVDLARSIGCGDKESDSEAWRKANITCRVKSVAELRIEIDRRHPAATNAAPPLPTGQTASAPRFA
jgi:D,D-heptose 1,7-bisphosphate phosphatase